jgi:hypothetical protein
MNPPETLGKLLSRSVRSINSAAARRQARRLQALSDQQERAILDSVLTKGLDQGWFFRVPEGELVHGASAAQDEILRAVLIRSGKPTATATDPFLDFNYPVVEIEGDEPGFIIVTQKCDLLQTIRKEPLVELARVRKTEDEDELTGIRKTSPRYFGLQDRKVFAWVVDLRSRAFLPKDALPALDGGHVLDREQRRRLALRLGDRYERQPIPGSLVDLLQRPLIDCLKKDGNTAHAAHFHDWRLIMANPKPFILAVTPPGADRQSAEDSFQALQTAMPSSVVDILDQDLSRVILFEDLTFAEWFNSISLDLDQVTYSKGARRDPAHAKRAR